MNGLFRYAHWCKRKLHHSEAQCWLWCIGEPVRLLYALFRSPDCYCVYDHSYICMLCVHEIACVIWNIFRMLQFHYSYIRNLFRKYFDTWNRFTWIIANSKKKKKQRKKYILKPTSIHFLEWSSRRLVANVLDNNIIIRCKRVRIPVALFRWLSV